MDNINNDRNSRIDYDKIAECLKYKAMVYQCTLKDSHPAYKSYIEAYNELNFQEANIVYKISPISLYEIMQS